MDEQLFQRSINSAHNAEFINRNIVTEGLVHRIGNSVTLEGHKGCVNCLDWNVNGTLLASGSDDMHSRIWDCAGNCLHEIKTGHTHNIFSSMFLPAGGDRVLITAAGDGTVRLHNYTHLDDEPYVWTCEGRVKRLCVAFNDPQMFWSASEDGVIRQFDARTNVGLPLLTFRGRMCKTMAVDQSNPSIIAVGTTDFYIPLYDRRMLKVHEPMMRLIPGHLSFEDRGAKYNNLRSHYATHLAFSCTGGEIIANIGSEQVYIFNVKNDPGAAIDVLKDINSFLNAATLLENPITNVEQRTTSRFKHLREMAKDAFGNHDFTKAIEIYSEGIAECEKLCGRNPSSTHEHAMDLVLLLANRGAGLLMRGWAGDAYACVRDTVQCLKIDPSYRKAHYRLARALIMLKQARVGNKCSTLFKLRYPEEKSVDRLDSMILELTKELEKRPQETAWHAATSGEQPYRDYTDRLCGHRNSNTDIKEANWWGGRNEFVVAGSDCGSLIIWERSTGRLLRMLEADSHIVNVVQPHPTRCLLATSGIDDVVRFWEPLPEDGSENEKVRDVKKYIDENNKRNDLMEFLVTAFHHVNNNNEPGTEGERRDDEYDDNGGGEPRVQCATS
ncbi:hypothetical protein QR680_009453 [Steinernema hermaphroditum]|uniref:WD and tetratricopeptide repeats protein 1 n=1 Tax=Steinernema hermaphroditum TaxID=289476 RepID=A0AA39M8V5_9BILA|nr:hypothetical protein QR680_009453 [Steinernema hermaphroditum]